ncbi:Ribonuclease HII [Candidatus Nitrosotalea sp. TS]|uniref:ribonuclease HII n=1 Tax=Candidatus Nitrosotalea sp. TS TaxID=2341020 RepID=UPI00140803E9|nr:ribonuclease HII [Candidatus Nitrosotalea sp. TS]NHI03230.1 Ribonuclease HII [Candidatus Nitrosotalea sp. TS]
MLVCGVDDAGRGSVIGPLVIAGICIERNKIKRLSDIGVKDSKQLSPNARENLYKKILAIVDDYYVARIPPHVIDQSVKKNELNQLEGKYMAKVIAKLKPDSSYVDSCDVNPKRFGLLISKLAHAKKVHSSHHADAKFPVVSAASIIAKVNRDRAIEKIRKNFNVGSGYPSDSKTMNFIKGEINLNGTPPKFVRKSWKPVKVLLGVN